MAELVWGAGPTEIPDSVPRRAVANPGWEGRGRVWKLRCRMASSIGRKQGNSPARGDALDLAGGRRRAAPRGMTMDVRLCQGAARVLLRLRFQPRGLRQNVRP